MSFPQINVGPNSIHFALNANSTGTLVRAGAGVVRRYYLSNSGASAAYVKLYDKATAGTSADTPIQCFMIPAGGAANAICAIPYTLGFSYRAVTGAADNDTTAPGSNEVIVNFEYE